MAGRWETHRGDEWWYTDFWCKFDAGFNSAYPGTLSIDRAEIKQGQLTETRLHNLLWSTQQQFKDPHPPPADPAPMTFAAGAPRVRSA